VIFWINPPQADQSSPVLSDSDKDKMIKGSGVPLNIVLVDKNKKVVFDTRIQGQSAKIISLAYGIGVAEIQLSETIGKPLLFGEQRGISGGGLEDIYITGFPLVQRDETKREDYYAYPLKRYDLSVTIGEIFLRPAHNRNSSGARRIECDADSALGMSGAPAFNELGEVIGILIKPIAFKVGSILVPTNQIYTHFRPPLSLSHVHDPDIKVAHAVRIKGDLLSIRAPGRENIPGQVVSKLGQAASIRIHYKDLWIPGQPGPEEDAAAIRTPTTRHLLHRRRNQVFLGTAVRVHEY